MDEEDRPDAELKVSARVLVQLGEELVTDAEQAILECVKNAYDADSPGCKIVIRTDECGTMRQRATAKKLLDFREGAENVSVSFTGADGEALEIGEDWQTAKAVKPTDVVRRHLDWTGRITIEDTGDGIASEKLRKSWLTISGSYKRSGEGKQKATTRLGRTPLGDKGVGRLGSMKLGDILKVETSTGPDQPLASAVFRWADCEKAETVDEIPVFVKTGVPNPERFKGTRVSIYGLKGIRQWANGAPALKLSLASLVSPFEAKAQFPVTVDVDNDKTSLVAVTESLLARAVADFHFTWQRGLNDVPELRCVARFKSRLFRADVRSSKTQKQLSDDVFGHDDGAGFLNWLSDDKRLKRYKIVPRPSPECFVEFTQTITWPNIKTSDLSAEDPGDFNAAFYYFNLRDFSTDVTTDAMPTDSEADAAAAAGLGIDRATIKRMAGISILRDGFRVRSQGDWLKLAEGMTSGGLYQLRVHNTLGYFALTGEQNFKLVEKSDRESFVENDAYRGFNAIAMACRTFANESLDAVRREMIKYAAQCTPVTDRPPTPERSFDVVEEAVQSAAAAKQEAQTIVSALQRGLSLVAQKDGESAAEVFKGALRNVQTMQRNLDDRAQSSGVVRMLRQDFSDSKERMLSLYESAAVGLSARGLAHELRTHIVEIRRRVVAIEELVKNGSADEKSIARHTRPIRAACASITSAAAIIDPLLPRTRAVKEVIDLFDFVTEYKENRKGGLDREGIDFEINGKAGKAVVKINRGRLLAVLDNLTRNSVYWLRRGVDVLEIKRPKHIHVDITSSGFSLFDSGPGIDPDYEDNIFDMFISAKPAAERGQGLGLFISSQLLAADGCSISLSTDKNQDGRRHKFIVDLGAVIQGGRK